ncbi:uncharacterized protein JCM10292_001430 [Rhodotorula paludigena]|uniref:uncharacterized protein n=1 Tax=Rhodotorula paludigena TaxID=86838 RepID=UPI0031760E80
MLATPPIHAPLQPLVFPPPGASPSETPAPPPPAASVEPAISAATSAPHRHAAAARAALEVVQRLSDQVDLPPDGGEPDDADEQDGGIIANLERHGWVYQETTSGIRIFHSLSQDEPAPLHRSQSGSALSSAARSAFPPRRSGFSSSQLGVSRGAGAPGSGGLRADEALPYFRGEGWIEGSWRREDVAATITSQGAQSVWDTRTDPTKSKIVAHLSETDSLVHAVTRNALGTARDISLLSSTANDERPGKSNVTYVLTCSVDDPLIPRSGARTTVHVNAFTLRSLAQPPDFEPPSEPLGPLPDASPPTRPSHRRTRSALSVMQPGSGQMNPIPLPPLPAPPSESGSPRQRPQLLASATHVGTLSTPNTSSLHPVPPPLFHTVSSYTSAGSSYAQSSLADTAGPYPAYPFGGPSAPGLPPPKRPSLPRPAYQGPGLAVSMVVRASAGANIPQSTVNQLSVHLPLNIAAIGRFLGTHGFAAHIVRTRWLHVREEDYDATGGRYRAVFTRDDSAADGGDFRIRFFGGAFGRGRFVVEVQHVEPDGWRVEYDVPLVDGQHERLDVHKESEEVGGKGSGQWTSRLVVRLRESADEADERQGRKGSIASLLSPTDSDLAARDPAQQPGPLGGCTIRISPSATQPFLPVIVTITRSTNDSAALPLAKMRGMSNALAQASQVVLDEESALCSSVEELLACVHEGDERADMCLKGARLVLRELDIAREREAASAAAAAAAAAFAKRSRRSSSASARQRSGSRGARDAISFTSPFPRPRKIAPPSDEVPQ